jgi:soluble lytic murein transglycosylase-like protein
MRSASRTGPVLASFCLAWLVAAPALAGPALAPDAVDRGAIDTARLLRAAGRLYDLDPDLLAAIAAVESGGNPGAVSPKGAEGLMQLMPATASRFGVIDSFDPVANALGAARFLSWMRRSSMGRYDGSTPTLPEMLAAYNAGEGAVDKYRGIPPYPETRQYVRKVLVTYLLGDQRTPLKAKLSAAAPVPERVLVQRRDRDADPLEKLAEIRRLRALALERAARPPAPQGSSR